MSGDFFVCHNWREVGVTSIQWVEAREDAKHPKMDIPRQQRISQLQMSTVLLLRNPARGTGCLLTEDIAASGTTGATCCVHGHSSCRLSQASSHSNGRGARARASRHFIAKLGTDTSSLLPHFIPQSKSKAFPSPQGREIDSTSLR